MNDKDVKQILDDEGLGDKPKRMTQVETSTFELGPDDKFCITKAFSDDGKTKSRKIIVTIWKH